MPSLRIVHVLTHGNVTRGGAIQALLLAAGQRAAGHDVVVVCNSKPGLPVDPSFEPWTVSGLPVLAFRMGLIGFEHPSELLRMRAWLATHRPDVVHVHRDTALVFTWLASLGTRIPAFISQRGTTHRFRTGLIARIHKSARVHRVIAVAEAVKEKLVEFGMPPEKVEVVYGSFDVDRFDPSRVDRNAVRRELGVAAHDRLVVQVGELHSKKAPKLFVSAARKVLALENNCIFALVGRGRKEAKLRQKIARSNVGARVKLLGFRPDIPEIYAAADIAVNSSIRDEGLTGALREALAMARPTVATRTDGNPEIVRDGETGVLVEKGSSDALAQGILTLLRDPARGRTMGATGRRLVLDLMHPTIRLERVEAVYRDVLARGTEALSAEGERIEA